MFIATRCSFFQLLRFWLYRDFRSTCQGCNPPCIGAPKLRKQQLLSLRTRPLLIFQLSTLFHARKAKDTIQAMSAGWSVSVSASGIGIFSLCLSLFRTLQANLQPFIFNLFLSPYGLRKDVMWSFILKVPHQVVPLLSPS